MKPALVLAALVLAFGAAPAAAPAPAPSFRVLAFTRAAGFQHASIPAAVAAVQALGAQNGFAVDPTEDAGMFTDETLAKYKVVMFLLTTGDVLDDNQQLAFQRFIERGGGFVGVHSAADTEYDWPWYHALLGATFKSHPALQQATVRIEDATDPLTAGLPAAWVRSDEWYVFGSDPRSAVHVLATVDESTYDPGDDAMGADHPIAWTHSYDGGRAWYTAMGHADEAYSEPLFLGFLLKGIEWAAGPTAPVPAGLPAPKIVSLTTALVGRRVVVSARHTSCTCMAALTVSVRGHARTTRVASNGTTTRIASLGLPPGRWQLTFILKTRSGGATAVARRWISVR